MKYWKMIKVDGKPSTSINENIPQHVDNDDLSDGMKKILEFMQNNSQPAPVGYDDTNLSDDEVNNVLSWLLDFQEKYFKEIPLPAELDKKFMWNIPHKLYKAAKDSIDYDEPDCMNPLFWFYLMLLDEPSDMIGKFILTAFNAISDDDKAFIEASADKYDYEYGIGDNDDE